MPEMKQERDLTPADFRRYPVWIGVHNFDSDEPWYEQADEETYRPWTGSLPFAENRGIVLIAATFTLADGSVYPGYCTAVRENWDAPARAYTTPGGTRVVPQSWSEMHGGAKLSILALQNPTLFVSNRPVDFHLRIPERRRKAVQDFYATIQKKPFEVFPTSFGAEPGLAVGIVSGSLEGLFYFPMGGSRFEIDRGESFLQEHMAAGIPHDAKAPEEVGVQPSPSQLTDAFETESRTELTLDDFRRNPVWVVVPTGETKSLKKRFKFVPWNGSLPVDSETHDVRIPARFTLRDGSNYEGYVRVVPGNWADITPAPLILGADAVIQTKSPRVRYGGSSLAIIGEHRPCMFAQGKALRFWCGIKDSDDLRHEFYRVIPKKPDEIFPIHFQGAAGLATGIVSGEIEGFYEIVWATGKPPRIVR
jgi:hypothetical protein